jgi:hypothetical protein
MSDEDDIVSALGLAEAPTPKSGQTIATPDILNKLEGGRKLVLRSAAEILGLPDAMKALRGEMTEDEASHFALTAAMGLLPGAKIENALIRGASSLASREGGNALTGGERLAADAIKGTGVAPFNPGKSYYTPEMAAYEKMNAQPDISDAAIAKKLASDPGASIFDVAGTHVGGASSSYMNKAGNQTNFPQSIFDDIPREGGVLATPLRASVMGRSENLVHGTRVLKNWETPSQGGAADIGTENDALKLPDDELGVHFGNPKQANVFSSNWLTSSQAPRQYPVVVAANNPLRMRDMGTWSEDRINTALKDLNNGYADAALHGGYKRQDSPSTIGQFPPEELDKLDGMKDYRDYIASKGYDSVVYKNTSEDPGHDSFIKFSESPVAPGFVTGVRSPWAKFDPNKLAWPELAAGLAGTAGGTGLLFDENNNPIVQTK